MRDALLYVSFVLLGISWPASNVMTQSLRSMG